LGHGLSLFAVNLTFANHPIKLSISESQASVTAHIKPSSDHILLDTCFLSSGSDTSDDEESMKDEVDSDFELEDEKGELATPSIDAQFLKTYALLKKKDARVYDPKNKFFSRMFILVHFARTHTNVRAQEKILRKLVLSGKRKRIRKSS
jgi:hypothetical protein